MNAEFFPQSITVDINPPKMNAEAGGTSARTSPDNYEGSYTVTPSSSAQTLSTDGLVMTDDVTVNAIPSEYIIPTGTKAISSSGSTDVTNYATASVPNGSATTPATTITASPSISVSEGGLITATASASQSVTPTVSEGWVSSGTAGTVTVSGSNTSQLTTLGATTYTPTKTGAQTISAGKFLTGDQTIAAIPEQYYDMSGDMAWLGKGEELVNGNVYSKSDSLNNTNFASWTPSTTAATMVATTNVTTFSADLDTYEYFLVWDCACDMDYTGQSPTLKAHFLFSRAYIVQEIMKRPSTFANVQSNTFDGNACVSLYTGNFLRYYGTTQGSVTYTWSGSYGIYFGATAATFSNSTSDTPTVTIKSPTLSARCSTTYFSTGNAAKVNQANSTYSITGKLYRVKKTATLRNIYAKVAAMIS